MANQNSTSALVPLMLMTPNPVVSFREWLRSGEVAIVDGDRPITPRASQTVPHTTPANSHPLSSADSAPPLASPTT